MDVFRELKFKLLVLTEAKLKGNKEVSWCEVNGINVNVQVMGRTRKGVAMN